MQIFIHCIYIHLVFTAGTIAINILNSQTATDIDLVSQIAPWRLYPNPTSGTLKLILNQIPALETYLTVTDITGKTILKQLILSKEELIDLGGNPPGIYLLKTHLKGMEVQKILLK